MVTRMKETMKKKRKNSEIKLNAQNNTKVHKYDQ